MPDFTDDKGMWMRTDCEKGGAHLDRFTKQIDQQNKDE